MIHELIAAIISVFLALVSIVLVRDIGGGAEITGGGRGVSGANRTRAETHQDHVYAKYKSLIPRGKMSFNDFCYPTRYRVQPQQKFAADYMKPRAAPREVLIFHKIGAGKTCLAIQICLRWLNRGKPLVVMPASLIPGFYNELRSQCAGELFISAAEREKLATLEPGTAEYKELVRRSDAAIDAVITTMSYNKFNDGAPAAPIIIIDEVQNINNTTGTTFRSATKWIEKHPAASVVIMSGTPIFDSPNEIGGLARLLRRRAPASPEEVADIFAGAVSYFAGAPAHTYPSVTISIKQCVFSPFQAKWYKSQTEAERRGANLRTHEVANNFYIKSRQRSDIVYPHGLGGRDSTGLAEMTAAHLTTNLATYSAKLAAMMKKLRRAELSFVYSSFTTTLAVITKALDADGWSDFATAGPGRKRYAVWSGDTPASGKDAIRATFNSAGNDDGSKLRVVLGSPSIKEGVSLLRLRSIHVFESYWNHSRLEQIYGRGIRYCSHKTLPRDERNVHIYIYAGVTRRVTAAEMRTGVDPTVSVDMYMLWMADKKRAECAEYIDALVDCAVDKFLWN